MRLTSQIASLDRRSENFREDPASRARLPYSHITHLSFCRLDWKSDSK